MDELDKTIEFGGHEAEGSPAELTPEMVAALRTRWLQYEGLDEINRGGMGVIYRAHDRLTHRDVAIKMVTPEMSDDPQLIARFLEEARYTAQLEHPNIVPVHELGLTPENALYFAMKKVEGESLADLLERLDKGAAAAWPLTRLLAIFQKACDAIAFAHSRQVIHRDLKPDNVMIGEFGEVLVLDWGLAKRVGEQQASLAPRPLSDSLLQQTVPGTIMGTLAYMPPEQATGEVTLLDSRSDIYSLGAMLYEILSLRSPIDTESGVEQALADVRDGRIEPPSQANPMRDVPRELEAVVRKAMAREPGDRYETVPQLQADIDAFLEGRTLTAARYTLLQRLGKWILRHRAQATAALTLTLLPICFVLVSHWQRRREIPELVRRAEQALSDGKPGQAIAVYDRVLEIDRTHLRAVRGRAHALTARDRAKQAARLADRRSQAALAIAEARRRIDGLRLPTRKPQLQETPSQRQQREAALGAYLAAASALDRALALVPDNAGAIEMRRLVGELLGRTALLGRDYTLARRAFLDLKRFGASQTEVTRLLGRVQDSREASQRVRASRLRRIIADLEGGTSRRSRSRNAPTLEDYIFEAVAYRDVQTVKILGAKLDGLATRRKLGPVVWTDGERELALFCCRVLGRLGLAEATAPLAGWLRVLTDQTLAAEAGLALCNTRDPKAYAPLVEARTRLRSSSLAWKRISRLLNRVPEPEGQLHSAADLQARGETRRDQGDLPGAHADFTAAIRLAPKNGQHHNSRGLVRHRQGNLKGALADFNQQVRLQPRAAHGYSNRAMVRGAQRDMHGALADYSQAIRLAPSLPESFNNRGHTLVRLRRYNEALRDLNRAIQLRPNYAQAYNNRGELYRKISKPAAALADYNRALKHQPTFVRAFNNRGILHHTSGRLTQAEEDFTRAIRIDPSQFAAYFNRALLRHQRNNLRGAEADITRVIQLQPRLAAAYTVRAMVRYRLRNIPGTEADIARTLQLRPRHPDALATRANVRRDRGDHKGALSDLNEAIRQRPRGAVLYLRRGLVRALQKDRQGAITDFSRALQLDPRLASAWLNRGVLHEQLGQRAKAVTDYRAYLELDPNGTQSKRIRAYLRRN